MRNLAAFDVKRVAGRAALTGLVGIWLAGCSSDSTRLSDSMGSNPFSNPFSTASNDASAPTPRVSSSPLASASPNADYAAAAHPSPVAVASLPPAEPMTTGQIKTAPAPAPTHYSAASANGWSAVGGSPVVVAQNDTLETLSRRYGVPPSAMLKTNGLSSASEVHGGMHLVIPVYSANAGAPAADKPKRVASEDKPEAAKHRPAKSEELASKDADAKAKREAKETRAEKEKREAEEKKKAHDKDAKAEPQKAGAPAPVVTARNNTDTKTTTIKKLPTTDATPTASVHPTETASAQPITSAQADANGVSPEFRWPARGRIIESFKAGGNDGINIAVPEGTSVRAAESGVVAYAGSELKGYGNLVLIRHPNGFVTAYANNGELDVKRGQTVKRGEVIAKSGQSGNVSSPQLHFELRKGSTPVDPTNYLAGL